MQRYRLNTLTLLITLYKEFVTDCSAQTGALSPGVQVLSTLRFLATNSFYHALRDAHGSLKSTVCVKVRKVADAINTELFNEFVVWPVSCDFAEDFLIWLVHAISLWCSGWDFREYCGSAIRTIRTMRLNIRILDLFLALLFLVTRFYPMKNWLIPVN